MSTSMLGFISDDRGVPGVSGKRITKRILVGAAAKARPPSESQATRRITGIKGTRVALPSNYIEPGPFNR